MAKLETILNELSRIVVVCHGVSAEEGKGMVHSLFKENADGVLEPVEKNWKVIPGEETPIRDISIHDLSCMRLKNITLEYETDLDVVEGDDGEVQIHTQLKRKIPFRKSSKNHIKIKAKYVLENITEGLELIRDAFNASLSKALQPKAESNRDKGA